MTCETCINWRLKEAGAMAHQGFGLCAKGPKWHFLPPQQSCSKHAQAEESVIAARVNWLGKLSIGRKPRGA